MGEMAGKWRFVWRVPQRWYLGFRERVHSGVFSIVELLGAGVSGRAEQTQVSRSPATSPLPMPLSAMRGASRQVWEKTARSVLRYSASSSTLLKGRRSATTPSAEEGGLVTGCTNRNRGTSSWKEKGRAVIAFLLQKTENTAGGNTAIARWSFATDPGERTKHSVKQPLTKDATTQTAMLQKWAALKEKEKQKKQEEQARQDAAAGMLCGAGELQRKEHEAKKRLEAEEMRKKAREAEQLRLAELEADMELSMLNLMSEQVSDKAREKYGEMYQKGELSLKTKRGIHAQLFPSTGYTKEKGDEIALFVELLHAKIAEGNSGDTLRRRIESLMQTHTAPTAWESLTVTVEARAADTEVATAHISAFFAKQATNGAAGISVTALERMKVLTSNKDKHFKAVGIPQAFKVKIDTPKKEFMDEIRKFSTIKIQETMWDLTVHANRNCMVQMRVDAMDRAMQVRIGTTLRESGLTDADIELHLLLHTRNSLPKHAENIIAVHMEDTKKVDGVWGRLRPDLIGIGAVGAAEATPLWEPKVYLVMKNQESAAAVSQDATEIVHIHASAAIQQQGGSVLCAKWAVRTMKKSNMGGTGEEKARDEALAQMKAGNEELIRLGESLEHLLDQHAQDIITDEYLKREMQDSVNMMKAKGSFGAAKAVLIIQEVLNSDPISLTAHTRGKIVNQLEEWRSNLEKKNSWIPLVFSGIPPPQQRGGTKRLGEEWLKDMLKQQSIAVEAAVPVCLITGKMSHTVVALLAEEELQKVLAMKEFTMRKSGEGNWKITQGQNLKALTLQIKWKGDPDRMASEEQDQVAEESIVSQLNRCEGLWMQRTLDNGTAIDDSTMTTEELPDMQGEWLVQNAGATLQLKQSISLKTLCSLRKKGSCVAVPLDMDKPTNFFLYVDTRVFESLGTQRLQEALVNTQPGASVQAILYGLLDTDFQLMIMTSLEHGLWAKGTDLARLRETQSAAQEEEIMEGMSEDFLSTRDWMQVLNKHPYAHLQEGARGRHVLQELGKKEILNSVGKMGDTLFFKWGSEYESVLRNTTLFFAQEIPYKQLVPSYDALEKTSLNFRAAVQQKDGWFVVFTKYARDSSLGNMREQQWEEDEENTILSILVTDVTKFNCQLLREDFEKWIREDQMILVPHASKAKMLAVFATEGFTIAQQYGKKLVTGKHSILRKLEEKSLTGYLRALSEDHLQEELSRIIQHETMLFVGYHINEQGLVEKMDSAQPMVSDMDFRTLLKHPDAHKQQPEDWELNETVIEVITDTENHALLNVSKGMLTTPLAYSVGQHLTGRPGREIGRPVEWEGGKEALPQLLRLLQAEESDTDMYLSDRAKDNRRDDQELDTDVASAKKQKGGSEKSTPP